MTTLPHRGAHWRAEFSGGCIACIPTVLGYLGIGFSAGALARIAGISVAEVALMSLILYAGSAQFVVAGMIQSQAAALSICAAVFFVNLRHLLMAASLVRRLNHLSAFKNFVLGAQLTDETFGVATLGARDNERLSFPWMLGLNLAAYVNWLIGTIAGALAITLIPEHFAESLQFALVAMFIGLIVLHITAGDGRGLQVFAALLAVALLKPASVLFGAEFGVILSAVIASLIAMGIRRLRRRGFA